MKLERRFITLMLVIVVVDLATKLLALNTLPFQQKIFLIGDKISFYLTFNEEATGGQAGYLLEQEFNKNQTLVLNAIAAFILIGFVFMIKKQNIKKLFKWLIIIGIYILTSIILELIKPSLNIEVSTWTASLVSKIAGISIYLTILTFINNSQLKLFFWMVISAGLGNLLSHFYYPYRIVDFINIDGSYELLRIGVFNLADLAFDLGIIGIFVTLIVLTVNKIKSKRLTTNAKNEYANRAD
ncbi:signal peptidase II [Croceimicrobium hydrocarbonivorans]|uniref:Signal peptidase II n=1 Tax=Croceimicrobium hydrocarbonivorans TaxID=2761580 RepID=A0A7H0VHC0_9FLAO|nr:signal peptidase II [Croceimicrobium hydrocarbonivorans]QNR25118.1 signal peptidase II [Croceimicrobium hydrocarbonivorans]